MKQDMQIKITPMLTSTPALKGRNTPAYGVSPMKQEYANQYNPNVKIRTSSERA